MKESHRFERARIFKPKDSQDHLMIQFDGALWQANEAMIFAQIAIKDIICPFYFNPTRWNRLRASSKWKFVIFTLNPSLYIAILRKSLLLVR